VDDNGVNLATGKVILTDPAVSIGGAGSGLSHSRTLLDGGWRHEYLITAKLNAGVMTVSFRGRSYTFTVSGSTYTSNDGSGATLVPTANGYTFTNPDGDIVGFTNYIGASVTAYATSVAYASGERLTLTYKNYTTFTPFFNIMWMRLQSVQSTQGYMLKYEYQNNGLPTSDPTGWTALKTVRAINSTVDYCDPAADSCASLSQAWPALSYARVVVGSNTQESVTDLGGQTTQFTFDGSSRIIGVKSPARASDNITYTYDANGRVATAVRDGVQTTYTWTLSGANLTSVISDASGVRRTVVADTSKGVILSDKDALNFTTTFSFDTAGRLTETNLPDGQKIQLTYDLRSNITVRKLVSKTPGTPADITQSWAYPTTCSNLIICNRPTSYTDALGNVTSYTYDATHGGTLTVTSPAVAGGQPQVRYGYSPLYAWYKNSAGALVQAPTPVYKLTSISACNTNTSCVGTADETKQTVSYQAGSAAVGSNLRPVNSTIASGNNGVTSTSVFTYDNVGNQLTVDGPLAGTADTTRTRYDAVRRVVGVVGPDPDGASWLPHRAVRYTYNADGQVTLSEVGAVAGQLDAQWPGFVSYQQVASTYDSNARKTKEVLQDSAGAFQVTQMSYDARGRLDCTALRMNSATWGSLPGACTAATAGAAGPDRITRTNYNVADQVTSVQVAVGTADQATERTLTYTPNGQVATVADGENNLTTYEYDGHSRLVKTRFPVATKGANASSNTDYEQLTLDANGNVTSRRMRDNTSIGFTYDALNRVTVKTLPAAEGSVFYSYDLQGRLKTAYQAWDTITFNYDALGRQTSVSNFLGTTSYQYDNAGRRTRLTWPDGFFVTYDYLVTGDLRGILENGVTTLAIMEYDVLGRRTQLLRGNGANTNYSYDGASRLSQLVQDPTGTAQDLTLGFSYNPASQIATNTRSNDTYAWTAHYNVTRPYTANGLNQYTLSGSVTPTYDGRGNLTSAGGPTFGYTQENRLATISGLGALTYDPIGRLVISSAQYATSFGYDGADMIGEYNASNQLLRRYVHGPGSDEPLVWYEGSGTTDKRFLLADERGSIISVTNSAGASIATNSYDEYGIPGANNLGRFQYTGQAWLPEFGLYHYKARAYSPTLGRFLQKDPIGYGDGMNMYAYTGGDPVNGRDPTGLSNCPAGTPSDTICVTAPKPSSPSQPSYGINGQISLTSELKSVFNAIGKAAKSAFCSVSKIFGGCKKKKSGNKVELYDISKATLTQNYFFGSGATVCLSSSQFSEALSQFTARPEKFSRDDGTYARGGDAYGKPLGYALGGFTMIYAPNDSPIGLEDEYDFNKMEYGVRDGRDSWVYPRENTTRSVGYIGSIVGAKDFRIKFPC
jgi:RHS repeat-associated protein